MIEKNQLKTKKVLFYTGTARNFRTTLIGHLFEISQKYPVILLSEKLDSDTEKVLHNKKFFPKLEKIIPISQSISQFNPNTNHFIKNRKLCKLAKKVIQDYRPNIFIFSDMPFELYLERFGRRQKLIQVGFHGAIQLDRQKDRELYVLLNLSLRSSYLPFWLRFFLAKCKKYFGHFLYYWLLPLSVGHLPFRVKSSFVLKNRPLLGTVIDYYIVHSQHDYDIFIKDEVPAEKLYILSHPLKRTKTRNFFERAFLNQFKQKIKKGKTATIILPGCKDGFRKKDHSLVSKEEREKKWLEIIRLIVKIFPDWKIYIKSHPMEEDITKRKEIFGSFPKNIEVLNPKEPIDKYIELGDVIMALPSGVSTVLYTAFLQCPQKPIMSLDFYHEFLGDGYKNFEGVEYIDNKEKFIELLKLIRDNKYQKKLPPKKNQINFQAA